MARERREEDGYNKKKSGFPAIVCRGAREKKQRERERGRQRRVTSHPYGFRLFLRHCFAVTWNVDASLKGTYRHVTHTLGLHGAYKASCNSEPRHNGRLRGYGEHGRQDRQQPGAIIVYTDDDLYVRSYMGDPWGSAAHAHIVEGGCAVSLFFFPLLRVPPSQRSTSNLSPSFFSRLVNLPRR